MQSKKQSQNEQKYEEMNIRTKKGDEIIFEIFVY